MIYLSSYYSSFNSINDQTKSSRVNSLSVIVDTCKIKRLNIRNVETSWDEMAELSVSEVLERAIQAHKSGDLKRAEYLYNALLQTLPAHGDANHNLGILYSSTGREKKAIKHFRNATKNHPKIFKFWKSQISALLNLERRQDAKKAIKIAHSQDLSEAELRELEDLLNRDNASSLRNIASFDLSKLFALFNDNKFKEAIHEAKSLIAKYPNEYSIWNTLGAAYFRLGNNEDALHAFREVVRLNPKTAEGYNNLGTSLRIAGERDEAISSYKRAILYKPDYFEAHLNLANTFLESDDKNSAIGAYKMALKYNPDNDDALRNLGFALRDVRLVQADPLLAGHIFKLLRQKHFVRPRDVSIAALSLIRLDPKFKKYLSCKDSGVTAASIDELIDDLIELPLLMELMKTTPIPDPQIEDVFKALRVYFLSSLTRPKKSKKYYEVQSAIALQCFINEYVYSLSTDERQRLTELKLKIAEKLENGDTPSISEILCIASYEPLHILNLSKKIFEWPALKEVLQVQVLNFEAEQKIKLKIPKIKEITDKVSSKVRVQYEENPYPKWVNTGLDNYPKTLSDVISRLGLRLSSKLPLKVSSPRILIAGCGTGQHSLSTASRYLNSQIIAIDLSLDSLAYAVRKTKELGYGNIEYKHLDILNVGELGESFDLIESVGVLHHMHDPYAGWQQLVKALKPGGLMKIGLYSSAARAGIKSFRNNIMTNPEANIDNYIREKRVKLLNSENLDHKRICRSLDFFSLSECRDLLFHEQEHTFDLIQIQQHLQKLGLNFCGFEAVTAINAFQKTYDGTNDIYNLDKWDQFEKQNPLCFSGMYQFWCQRKA